MSSLIPFNSDQSAINHYRSFINLWYVCSDRYAQQPFIRYPSNGSFKILSYADVDHITTNLACQWYCEGKKADVITFMSDHNAAYLVVMLAIFKLRITLLTLSPRNSEPAIVNLLQRTQSKLVMTTEKYKEVARAAAAKVPGVKTVVLLPIDMDGLLKKPFDQEHKMILNTQFSEKDLDTVAMIMHSSGSTDYPKPIWINNRCLLSCVCAFEIFKEQMPNIDIMNHKDIMLSCTPLFHSFAVTCVFSAIITGASVCFLEKLPSSPVEIDSTLKSNRCTVMSAPAIILEQTMQYLKETRDLSAFQRLNYIIFAGASLQPSVGEWFHSHQINVRCLYGSTETGPIMCADLNRLSANWLSLSPRTMDANGNSYCRFEDSDRGIPGEKHMFVTPGCPSLAVVNRPDGGYNTNDLFVENAEYPGYYRHVGRRDDTLVLSNGEKVNPIPMEATIRSNPSVRQVVILGNNRPCTAALVEANSDSDPKEIHRVVKEANKECPSHSILLPQMVHILPSEITLPSSDKGTILRKRCDALFEKTLNALYKKLLSTPKATIGGQWDREKIGVFLVQSTAHVLGLPVDAIDPACSVFDLGLNSLTAIQLCNTIAKNFQNVSHNFLFQHPLISTMQQALLTGVAEDATEARYRQTQALAEAYIERAQREFPVAEHTFEKRGLVVLLTGATGSLGSFILRDLLSDCTVRKVYCMIRGPDMQARLTRAFETRHLDTILLSSGRLEILPMRLDEPHLGLTGSDYDQLKKEVTIVLHCAWLLDFNMPIDHYDKTCIAPFYNLLQFAYKRVNPIRVHFISSVSACYGLGKLINEVPLPLDAHVALPMGYAQSKFVCEVLLNYLAQEKKFPCFIERTGQICGDTIHGTWNPSEQYPLLFATGPLLRMMPSLDVQVDWIPVDYASAAITRIVQSDSLENTVHHITNPHTQTWSSLLQVARASGMVFDTVDPNQWTRAISQDQSCPAYSLLSYFEDCFKLGVPQLSTERTRQIVPLLDKTPLIDSVLFSKYLKYWQNR